MRRILFIQGAGEGTHDQWDRHMVESLRDALGDSLPILYPFIEAEADPTYTAWEPALAQALQAVRDGDILIGHSFGGTFLLRALCDLYPAVRPAVLCLIAAPYAGEDHHSGAHIDTSTDLYARLAGVSVHLFHGTADDIAPMSNLDPYAQRLPHAHVHRLAGYDHQLNNDLSAVAEAIRDLPLA